MVAKGDIVTYIDCIGQEFNALVTSVHPFSPGVISLVYVDPVGDERDCAIPDNIRRMIAVVHVDHESKNENNPRLPRRVLNAWKEKT